MKKTKIICTLGPAVNSEEEIVKLIDAGMNIARLNFSHGTKEEQAERIKMVRAASLKTGQPVGILLDTKGPEIRTGKMENNSVFLREGDMVIVTVENVTGTSERFSVNYPELPKSLCAGDWLLIDDGILRLRVDEVRENEISCRVINGGELRNNKGVNIPGIRLNLPAITEKDREDILFGLEQGIDFIAASFVRGPEAITMIRSLCDSCGKDVAVIAKIENKEGIQNIDAIIDASDGIMIARGDMGVEIPPEEVPYIQKMIIKKCNFKMKPVITATQMLDSMIRNPAPTRAEAADVANAIYDGTDAVMLSGETAMGRYPVASVTMMAKIAEETENHLDEELLKRHRDIKSRVTISSTIAHMSVNASEELHASCIIAATMSGTTACYLSKFRPSCIIAGVTPDEHIMRRMQLYWGVYPMKNRNITTTDDLIHSVTEQVKKASLLQKGDICVLTAGIAARDNSPYTTNMIRAFRME